MRLRVDKNFGKLKIGKKPRPILHVLPLRRWHQNSKGVLRLGQHRRVQSAKVKQTQLILQNTAGCFFPFFLVSVTTSKKHLTVGTLIPNMLSIQIVVWCCKTIFCEYIYSEKLANLHVNPNCLIFLLHSYELGRMHVTDGWFDGTGPLACLSSFSVMLWIRSNYLFQSEACYSNV